MDPTSVSFAPIIQQVITDVLLPILGIIITGVITWVASKASAKFGIDIEAKYRDSLHSAAMTGVTAALTKLGGTLPETVDVKSAVVAEGIAWVEKSVPDALKSLGVTPASLQTIVESKLTQALGTTATITPTPATPTNVAPLAL